MSKPHGSLTRDHTALILKYTEGGMSKEEFWNQIETLDQKKNSSDSSEPKHIQSILDDIGYGPGEGKSDTRVVNRFTYLEGGTGWKRLKAPGRKPSEVKKEIEEAIILHIEEVLRNYHKTLTKPSPFEWEFEANSYQDRVHGPRCYPLVNKKRLFYKSGKPIVFRLGLYPEPGNFEEKEKKLLLLSRSGGITFKTNSRKNPKNETWSEEEIRHRLETEDLFVMRAICALFRRQEEFERLTKSTTVQNFQGFNAFHAKTGSRYAKFMSDGHNDGVFRRPIDGTEKNSEGQEIPRIEKARKIALFYAKQLTELANKPGDPKTKRNPAPRLVRRVMGYNSHGKLAELGRIFEPGSYGFAYGWICSVYPTQGQAANIEDAEKDLLEEAKYYDGSEWTLADPVELNPRKRR